MGMELIIEESRGIANKSTSKERGFLEALVL